MNLISILELKKMNKFSLLLRHGMPLVSQPSGMLAVFLSLTRFKFVEEGGHDDLVELNSIYAKLLHLQSGDLFNEVPQRN